MTTITVDILKCQMGLEDLETFLLEVGYPVIDLPSKVSKNSSSLVSYCITSQVPMKYDYETFHMN